MSGHSKWSSIKHKKKINDEKRSKLFSKLVKNIRVSLKSNNDIEKNTKLKVALTKASEKNLKKSIINKILIKKKFNSDEKFLYTGISLYNSIFIIECFDDNHNKIISELKHLFLQYSGSITQYRNVELLFDKFINIKIEDFYNEYLLLDKFIDINLYKCIDNKLVIDLKNFLKVKDIINVFKLNFNYCYEIIPKNFIKLNNNNSNFLVSLKNKILEKEYVSNVFINFY